LKVERLFVYFIENQENNKVAAPKLEHPQRDQTGLETQLEGI
jgi:hypothetical protein